METTLTSATGFWHQAWLGNTPLSWICAVGGAFLGYLLVHTALRWARRLLAPRAERTGRTALTSVVEALRAVRPWLLALLALAIGIGFLTFGSTTEYWLHLIEFVLVGLQLVLCINRIIVTWLIRTAEPSPLGERSVMIGILIWTCQFVVWLIFLLALLTNAGINITAFIASLGVGGIAIALAAQNILGDLFASVAIGLDKPFEPGEFIEFGTSMGTVKKVGIKSTRIESLSGEELAIANTQLLSQLTRNYSRMPERRVVFGFTVPYGTTGEQLREITERTNAIISAAEPVRFDRGHFTGFGADGFTFEFVYYVLDSSYSLYLDVQQQINQQIIDVLESLGVRFALPARAVVLGDSSLTP